VAPANEGDSFLSWEEVEEMSRGGIDFGSHGLTHEILTNVSADEVRNEVLESRRILEERIRKRVVAFSYPNGDHDPVVRRCTGECGYEVAFGTERGFAAPGDDPLSLKRVNVHDDVTREVPMFLTSILGMI
jgi:peptidoglycan/xylan/chitin deacetylase (PgdA/CDA1 family)